MDKVSKIALGYRSKRSCRLVGDIDHIARATRDKRRGGGGAVRVKPRYRTNQCVEGLITEDPELGLGQCR